MLRELRKKELKEKIFRESVRLFKEKRYENVTVEEITNACGIAKGTFYNYFSRKEDVLLYLGNSQLERLHESMQRYADEKTYKNKLKYIFADLLKKNLEHADLTKSVISEIVRSQVLMSEEAVSIQSFQKSIAGLLHDAKQKGQIAKHWNVEHVASTLIGIYFHVLLRWFSSTNMNDNEIVRLFDNHFEIVWEGIAKESE